MFEFSAAILEKGLLGFLADVYLDDFYGADSPERASTVFTSLKQLLQELGH